MPTEATVTQLDDERLIREGEAAVDQYNRGLKSARTSIMPMARGLLAAKLKYPATQDFGDWLQTSPYREIEKDDRAALLKIGEQGAFAEKFVRTTSLISPQTIWDAIESLMSSSYHTNSAPETPPQSQPPAEITTVAKTDEPPKNPPAPNGAKPVSKRSKMYGAPRADELSFLFQNKSTRNMIAQIWQGRGGKQIWELIITALDAGLITPNRRDVEKPNLALLFPAAPPIVARSYDLSNQMERTRVRQLLLPTMIACREKLLAEPDRFREIIAEHEKGQRNQQQAAVTATKRAVAVAALPPVEQELMMFGQTVWPRLDIRQGDYDYDQVRAAIWTFRDYESWNQMAKEDTGSHALRVRNSLRYLGEYIQRTDRNNPMAKIFSLILWFSRLMEKNPKGECKWPMYPHVEGQW